MAGKRPQPARTQAPVVQRLHLRYAKRGNLRFASHRDFARALERAVRRAGVPIAYSQGFTPHPKISYAGAAPTGVASSAEYLELALRERTDPAAVARALDAALPSGLDVVEAVEAGPGGLADRIDASAWRIEIPGLTVERAAAAVTTFLAATEIHVGRVTKRGERILDVRGPIVRLLVKGEADVAPSGVEGLPCAILDLVVRHVIPTVRPDDVLTGLRAVADLELCESPRATRLAQGGLAAEGEIVDPLAADRDAADWQTSSA
ncbi:MAG: DUF2344 domain-containing protein [Dactylosporangium sp.]|nr:TIGR03936 family radical SAM-associated protein [Dactylosporangium sp.]NNJ59578.1 DUF2344 domain-containing protein [Dactylosporangium sp.]